MPVGFVPLQADLDFQGPDLIEPQRGHAVEQEERQRVLELPVGVVPEDDALPLLVEEAFQRRVDLVQVAHSSPSPWTYRPLARLFVLLVLGSGRHHLQAAVWSKPGTASRICQCLPPDAGRQPSCSTNRT